MARVNQVNVNVRNNLDWVMTSEETTSTVTQSDTQSGATTYIWLVLCCYLSVGGNASMNTKLSNDK